MTETTKNPLSEQLRAGGKVSGACKGGLLTFVGRTLVERDNGSLYIEEGDWRYCIVTSTGLLNKGVTVYSYTSPKGWWETCPGDTWMQWTDNDGKVRILTVQEFRQTFAVYEDPTGQNLRRVRIVDADTEIVAPKEAFDNLSAAVAAFDQIGRLTGVRDRNWLTDELHTRANELVRAVEEINNDY